MLFGERENVRSVEVFKFLSFCVCPILPQSQTNKKSLAVSEGRFRGWSLDLICVVSYLFCVSVKGFLLVNLRCSMIAHEIEH
jgi:hypothetical protein